MQEKSLPHKTSSAEEISETIMEEEEHGEENKVVEKTDSNSSLVGNEILESNTLQSENSVLREVTVAEGEWYSRKTLQK